MPHNLIKINLNQKPQKPKPEIRTIELIDFWGNKTLKKLRTRHVQKMDTPRPKADIVCPEPKTLPSAHRKTLSFSESLDAILTVFEVFPEAELESFKIL
jgi:hypothetical protein